MKQLLLGLLVSAVFPVLCAQEMPRTYVDSLVGTTPEHAVETFVDRFAAKDYFSVYYQLSPRAREQFFVTIARMFSFAVFFDGPGDAVPPGSAYDPDRDRNDELPHDRSLNFDNLLVHADKAGWLPFGFTEHTEIVAVEARDDDALATVATGTEPAEVQIRLVANPSGQWYVDRITWAGSDHESRPWGIVAQ